jgi:hypothetical protein
MANGSTGGGGSQHLRIAAAGGSTGGGAGGRHCSHAWPSMLQLAVGPAPIGSRRCSHGRQYMLPRVEASLLRLVARRALQRAGTGAASPRPESCKQRPTVIPTPSACATNIDPRRCKWCFYVLPTATGSAANGRRRSCKRRC